MQRALLSAYRQPDLPFRLPLPVPLPNGVRGIDAQAERPSVAPESGGPGPEDEEEGEEQPAGLLGKREEAGRHGWVVGEVVSVSLV